MSKRSKKLKSDKDMLSILPDNIIDNILVRLPLEQAINTSLLSTFWRYKWSSMSEINVDYLESFRNMDKHGNKVFRFMLLHRANIQRFALNNLDDLNLLDIDILLNHLVGHQIQQLILGFVRFYDNDDYYFIPSLVFSFDKLTTLDIKSYCRIKLPSSFDGFKSLTTLVLHHVIFASATTLQRLIDLSPLLKHLNLCCSYSLVLNLNTPNLRVLKYHGPFSHLKFMQIPLITKVSLSRTDERPYDLPNLLGSLSKVSNLQLSATDFCPIESALQEIKFNLLKILNLTVCLDCPQEYAIVYCILENSPKLVHLQITLAPRKEFTNSSEIENTSFMLKNHIKIFDINIDSGLTSEMKFIKYVLRNSPLLKVVNVKLIGDIVELSIEKKVDILKELLSFERASSVKVYFFGLGKY